MNYYRYVKAKPQLIVENIVSKSDKFRLSHILAAIFLLLGIGSVGSVIWPIAYYQLFITPNLSSEDFLSPLPVVSPQILGSNQNQDYTKPENWFPQVGYSRPRESKITHYTISIPKLNIKDAVVEIGGIDLSQALIHYPQTALPGEVGATVIFGHSILPQFYNPSNYLSIFSLIPTLNQGDEIFLKFDGITYTYRVIDKVEVKPTNLTVLDQPYDNEYLRLITCTPPGTYLRRGVITAALID
jgi:sortase A